MRQTGWRLAAQRRNESRRTLASHRYATLESQVTVTDPKTYTEPWVTPVAQTKLYPGHRAWTGFLRAFGLRDVQ